MFLIVQPKIQIGKFYPPIMIPALFAFNFFLLKSLLPGPRLEFGVPWTFPNISLISLMLNDHPTQYRLKV